MMPLQKLLPECRLPAPVAALPVPALRLDSRAVGAGDLFLAVPGHNMDGRRFIDAAITAGAAVVLEEGDLFHLHQRGGAICIAIPDLRRLVGEIAARFFGEPGTHLRVIGVTGTNGKTSITWFLRDALNALGHACGLMGTLGVGLKGRELDTGHTTPDPITLQRGLRALLDDGADHVAMEVSSHALDQHRLGDTPVSVSVFSNLSRDHLDYHGDMDTYLAAKAALFTRPELKLAVINGDDEAAPVLLARLNDGVRCITFGEQSGATVRCLEYRPHEHGMDLTLSVGGERVAASLPLFGRFNLSNVMAVAGVLHGLACALRGDQERVGQGLAAITAVPGRMEPVREAGKPTVLVDYAHTPDGLEKALGAVRDHFPGRLHCVVGCGGDRDTGKRPLMAAVAERLADRLIFTSDNPRGENPDAIIDAMMGGLAHPERVERITERGAAVARAVAGAEPGDVVLLAGKGHETYQDVAGHRYPMDDRQLAHAALARWGDAP